MLPFLPHAPLVATVVALAYALGSIPWGLLVARGRGMDIRQHGSGNIGATNVWRVLGKKWGLLTFALDAGKGLVAVLVAKWLAGRWPAELPLPYGKVQLEYLEPAFAGIAAALGCLLGHTFPVWLRFKGGKGVATALGVMIGMVPLASLVIFVVWGVVLKLTRYVSLASLIAAVALPLTVLAMLFAGWLHGWAHFYFAAATAGLVIRRHTGNIRRLIEGTEHRFGTPKPDGGTEGERG